jgi:hypothetical protein
VTSAVTPEIVAVIVSLTIVPSTRRQHGPSSPGSPTVLPLVQYENPLATSIDQRIYHSVICVSNVGGCKEKEGGHDIHRTFESTT